MAEICLGEVHADVPDDLVAENPTAESIPGTSKSLLELDGEGRHLREPATPRTALANFYLNQIQTRSKKPDFI